MVFAKMVAREYRVHSAAIVSVTFCHCALDKGQVAFLLP